MRIFCSGIGGIGLSAYASLQREFGHEVFGSDRADSPLLEDLRSQGVTISLNQDGSALPEDLDLFVYSEAIPPSAPERLRASELGVQQLSYPQALGKMTESYTVIAVCGTHGKSSTTAIAARLLIETGRDPTVVVGTKVKELGGRNWRRGNSSLFLIEACEYRKSFHFYRPQIILMTNCDGDHFDAYRSLELYQEAFRDFIKFLPQSGTLITHMGDEDCAKVAHQGERETLDADQFPLIDIQTPGVHMQQNAQLVLGLAKVLQIPQEDAVEAIKPFSGTWRRMEFKGTTENNVTVVDDYAHHPREIRATLKALRGRYPNRRIVAVFQPHTHNRTVSLYENFLGSFTDCDLLLIPNIYDARADTETELVDPNKLAADIAEASGIPVTHTESLEKTEKMLKNEILQDGDVLICMGAGNVTHLTDMILPQLA